MKNLASFLGFLLVLFTVTVFAQNLTGVEETSLVVIEKVKTLINNLASDNLRTTLKVDSNFRNQVATETHTQLVFSFQEDGVHASLEYDKLALAQPKLLFKDLAVLLAVTEALRSAQGPSLSEYIKKSNSYFSMVYPSKKNRLSSESVAEVYIDAAQGSLSAKSRVKFIEAKALENIVAGPAWDLDQTINLYNDDLRSRLASESEKIGKQALERQKLKEKEFSNWKTQTRSLDLLDENPLKLNDLILKSDRQGVVKLLRSYLPWPLMEPLEKLVWEEWLNAIEFPDWKNSVVAFRGLDYSTDKIQRSGESFGFMSTVLTKNQGNYNRRLRSLTTNRIKNGEMLSSGFNAELNLVKIFDQMEIHSIDPKASSFLSFTLDPRVADRFAARNLLKEVDQKTLSIPRGGFLAVKIDSRRMIPNLVSSYTTEIELLTPLVVFPDEVVLYHEGSFTKDDTLVEFLGEVAKRTGQDLNKWVREGELLYSQPQSFADDFKDGFRFFSKILEKAETSQKVGSCVQALE
jgi:hypothetical protein